MPDCVVSDQYFHSCCECRPLAHEGPAAFGAGGWPTFNIYRNNQTLMKHWKSKEEYL